LPGRLLRGIDLAEVKHMALHHFATVIHATIFNQAPVMMFLAIFEAGGLFEKHDGQRLCPKKYRRKEGRSALQGFWKIRLRNINDLRRKTLRKFPFSQANSGSRVNQRRSATRRYKRITSSSLW
jgi:hypothetical protein